MKSEKETLNHIVNLFDGYMGYAVGAPKDFHMHPHDMKSEDFEREMAVIVCEHSGHKLMHSYNRCIRCGEYQIKVEMTI